MQSRPWRVFALALLAVIAMTGVMGEASVLLRDVSGHRYADELIRDQLASVDTVQAVRKSS